MNDVINISKINEGFFISDQFAAMNQCLLIHVKITHLINVTGNQKYNNFEHLGIKYLTVNWNEQSSQKLFDKNDVIVNQIISFIESAMVNGQGLLAFSIKGINRVCIVAIVFLMRKYLWTFNRSLDYLKSRKKELAISSCFVNQLVDYESKLICKGMELSSSWEEKDQRNKEEIVMRNTYVNGLPLPKVQKEIKEGKKKKVEWNYHIRSIANVNNDLFLQSAKKNVDTHLQYKKLKSCLKNKKQEDNIIKDTNKIYQQDNKDVINSNENVLNDNNRTFVLKRPPSSNTRKHIIKNSDRNNNNMNHNNNSINNEQLNHKNIYNIYDINHSIKENNFLIRSVSAKQNTNHINLHTKPFPFSHYNPYQQSINKYSNNNQYIVIIILSL